MKLLSKVFFNERKSSVFVFIMVLNFFGFHIMHFLLQFLFKKDLRGGCFQWGNKGKYNLSTSTEPHELQKLS